MVAARSQAQIARVENFMIFLPKKVAQVFRAHMEGECII